MSGSSKYDPTKVSPWLQLTKWPQYLDGLHLPAVAALVSLPLTVNRPVAAAICDNLDLFVKRPYVVVCDDLVDVSTSTGSTTFYSSHGR